MSKAAPAPNNGMNDRRSICQSCWEPIGFGCVCITISLFAFRAFNGSTDGRPLIRINGRHRDRPSWERQATPAGVSVEARSAALQRAASARLQGKPGRPCQALYRPRGAVCRATARWPPKRAVSQVAQIVAQIAQSRSPRPSQIGFSPRCTTMFGIFTESHSAIATLSATSGHSLRFASAIRQLALCLTEKHNFISPNDDRKRGSNGNKQSQRHQAQRFRNLKHFGSDRVGTEAEETCPADSSGHVEEEKANRRHPVCAGKQSREHS
jgi:hypothetical protein